MNLSAICYLKRSLLKKIPYYLNWITKFHEFCDIKAETPITSENIDRYLNKLSSIYEPWQIQQASDAVSLYRFCQRGKSTPLVQNLHPSNLQRAIKRATKRGSISKRITVHTLRHSFATHPLPFFLTDF